MTIDTTEPRSTGRLDPPFGNTAVDRRGRVVRHEPRDRPSAIGDDDRLALRRPLHVFGQLRLQLSDTDLHVTTLPSAVTTSARLLTGGGTIPVDRLLAVTTA